MGQVTHTEHKHAGSSTEHHREDMTPPHSDTDLGDSDQTTHSACLLTPPPATQNKDGRCAPGHCLPYSRPCGCDIISAEWRPTSKVPHTKWTRTGMHTHTASLAECALGQGLILTESLPLYILCQKTEYTKGNLALSTKQ